jgi:glycosyltransferase involved in cell wall biosynthesis
MLSVVSSDVAENREIVENEVNGLFADSAEMWEISLVRLIDDSNMRIAMGESGRKLVEEKYSVAVATNIFIAVLDSI